MSTVPTVDTAGDTRLLQVLRPQRALLGGVLLLMTAAGLQASLLGLRARAESFGDLAIGGIAGAYFAGFLVGSLVIGRLLRRMGHVRAFGVLASAASALVLVHSLVVALVPWLLARLASGLVMGAMLVIVESWLSSTATEQTRGRVLSAYMLMTTGGYVIGQLVLATSSVEQFTLFAVVSMLLSLALVPILSSQRPAPEVTELPPLPVRELLRRAPAAVLASLTAGVTWGAIAGLAPVVADSAGLDRRGITLFVGGFLVGHLLSEGLVGTWSDRTDRRFVAGAVATAAAIGAFTAAAATSTTTLLVAGAMVVGAGAFPLYSLSIAMAGDRVEPREAVGAAVTLVRTNGIGAAVAPIVVSATVGTAPRGFLLVLGSVLAVAAGLFLTRRLVEGRVPPDGPDHVRLSSRAALIATTSTLRRRPR